MTELDSFLFIVMLLSLLAIVVVFITTSVEHQQSKTLRPPLARPGEMPRQKPVTAPRTAGDEFCEHGWVYMPNDAQNGTHVPYRECVRCGRSEYVTPTEVFDQEKD